MKTAKNFEVSFVGNVSFPDHWVSSLCARVKKDYNEKYLSEKRLDRFHSYPSVWDETDAETEEPMDAWKMLLEGMIFKSLLASDAPLPMLWLN